MAFAGYPSKDDGDNWSGRQDLNLRPLAPHASALPGCATPRTRSAIIEPHCFFARQYAS